jgi:drug/metabolite transporter (DMT)-like permease
MTASSLSLLLTAAFLHSFWNLLAKRSVHKVTFLMLATTSAAILFAPLALSAWRPIPLQGWLIIVASGAAEAAYYLLLGAAYRNGDLSLVYPLSRGSSPLFVTLIALIFLGEQPSRLGALGITLVVCGIYVLHLNSFARAELLMPLRSLKQRSSQLAVLTGLAIATYSVLDKLGIRYAEPLTYIWIVLVVSVALLLPYLLLRKRDEARTEIRSNWLAIIVVGAIVLGGYTLILVVLRTTPVSYATSVRGISVVFGTLLGMRVLRERFTIPKLAGALTIFVGVVCIGLA